MGHKPGAPSTSGNARNGTSPKTPTTDQGDVAIKVPRDRNGTLEPQLVKKHQRRFTGFDDKIQLMYARGMSVRDIQAHLSEIYGTEISPTLISTVTDAVVDEVAKWQARPLDPIWPIVYLDALALKVRDQGVVQNKQVYVAMGISLEGKKEVLGLWMEPNEGAKFWLKVITELKNRGVEYVFLICCDGLKGFPQAIEAVFPKTIVQTCIVHLIRSSTRFVAWVNRKALIADLRRVYAADTEEAALAALAEFEKRWADRYPMVANAWRTNWERVRPFFTFGKEVRKIIYTTNAIESLNFSLRKVTKARGPFPNDEAALKLFYLAIHNMEKKWTRQSKYWNRAQVWTLREQLLKLGAHVVRAARRIVLHLPASFPFVVPWRRVAIAFGARCGQRDTHSAAHTRATAWVEPCPSSTSDKPATRMPARRPRRGAASVNGHRNLPTCGHEEPSGSTVSTDPTSCVHFVRCRVHAARRSADAPAASAG